MGSDFSSHVGFAKKFSFSSTIPCSWSTSKMCYSGTDDIESLGAVYVWGEIGSDVVSLLVLCNLLPQGKIFDDTSWEYFVVLAKVLVNINVRFCNDQRCLYPQKPLLKSESGNDKARDGLDGALITEDSNKSTGLTVDPAGAPTTPLTSTDKLYQPVVKNEKRPRIRAYSIEDEAWNLLHESIVYYCNPVGTIVANDRSSTSILNGDQRWEKTMDCPSPRQGLMPASFKALFYSALLCAREMLAPEDGSTYLIQALTNRMGALSFHIREYYWIDMKKLNEIYRYKSEEYSYDAVNKFNIYPDQIPPWLAEWMPHKGGYLIGNLQPSHIDFRLFSLENFWSLVRSFATTDQSHTILDLIEAKWADLAAVMPFKLCYPALESQEWRLLAARDGHGWVCECLLWLRAHFHAEDSKWDTSILCARRSSGRRPYIECVLLDEPPLKIGLSSSTVWLKMVCEAYGGRVDQAKVYYKAIIASVRKHFKGNGAIASKKLYNDFISLGT